MKWISVEDRLPVGDIIVAIINGRQEWEVDPIYNSEIILLRSNWCKNEWRNMSGTGVYYLPKDEGDYYETIKYWMPWEDFVFPESMIGKRSKI
jgi:hypothetical protein